MPVLSLLFACVTEARRHYEAPSPSFMEPTSEAVRGRACAWSPEQLELGAGALVQDRWSDLGEVVVGGLVLDSPEALSVFLETGTIYDRELAALGVNLAMDRAELFGRYADFEGAELVEGELSGTTAGRLFEQAQGDGGVDLQWAMASMNRGFGGCDYTWYLTTGADFDGDGVLDAEDCDDEDATIGLRLHQDDLDGDDGSFEPTEALGEDWAWDGGSVYATSGGQEAMLHSDEGHDDVVVISTLSALGTQPGCGFDCTEECAEYTPDDDCWTDYQALALGILTFEVSGVGLATLSNSDPDYDVCLEGFAMWDRADSQSLVVGEEVLAGETYRIPAGGSLELAYGSWTTDNGVHAPYLDEPSFWCYQAGTTLAAGDAYDSIGAWLPEDLQDILADDTDSDADGVEDHVDWAGGGGVQSQYNVWEYQDTHAMVAIGKLAESTADGTVQVTLTLQNRGALSTLAAVEDTVPALWSLVGCDDSPDSQTSNSDGTSTLSWNVTLDGCVHECAEFHEHVVTCELAYNLATDLNHVDLPQASASYDDGAGAETSWSMPAAAFAIDTNADGDLRCGETDRWRAGVLGRAELDDDQDEGFHGYRCALAQNSEQDCFESGTFLQIAAFLDTEEDDIFSECTSNCTNSSFDQLARTNHAGAIDLLSEDVELRFWIVGEDLYCKASDADGNTVTASATDTRLSAGAMGMSTLNAFGDYEDIELCEAYGVPE
jgi:hypothetical protein